MDEIQEQHELATGNDFVHWYNKNHGTDFHFDQRGDPFPDLIYFDGKKFLYVEVTAAYYDSEDAKFKWMPARGKPNAPNSWYGKNPTSELLKNINTRLEEKCSKQYPEGTVLVIWVLPPVTSAKRLEERLEELVIPERSPFQGIFLTGTFGVTSDCPGGYRCWQIAGCLTGR